MSDLGKYRNRFLKADELKRTGPQTKRITKVEPESVRDPQTNGTMTKAVIEFDDGRALILNATNLDYLFNRFNSTDSDAMINELVTVFYDENVMFGSQRRGGIRLTDPDEIPF